MMGRGTRPTSPPSPQPPEKPLAALPPLLVRVLEDEQTIEMTFTVHAEKFEELLRRVAFLEASLGDSAMNYPVPAEPVAPFRIR